MTSVVLDASALLAVLNAQPGADIVRAAMSDAVISAINYSEVLKRAIQSEISTQPLFALLRGACLDIVPLDSVLARATAELYPETKAHGLSLADRAAWPWACSATRRYSLQIVSGDSRVFPSS